MPTRAPAVTVARCRHAPVAGFPPVRAACNRDPAGNVIERTNADPT